MKHKINTIWFTKEEQLPEENDFVLITVEDGTETAVGTAVGRRVLMAHYSTEDGVEESFQTIGYGDVFLNDEVVAWSPIPEPYED